MLLQCEAFFCPYRTVIAQTWLGSSRRKGRADRRVGRRFKESPSSSQTPHTCPHCIPPTHDAGDRDSQGTACPQHTALGYWDTGSLGAQTAWSTVAQRLATELQKKSRPPGGHGGGSWRKEDRTWSGAWRPQWGQGDLPCVWAQWCPSHFPETRTQPSPSKTYRTHDPNTVPKDTQLSRPPTPSC